MMQISSTLDQEIFIQSNTLLGARLQRHEFRSGLQAKYWPPVNPVERLWPRFAEFINLSESQRATLLMQLRNGPRERFGEFLHMSLGEVYAYLFGYQDGVATQDTDDALESAILTAKIRLEREFLNHWIGELDVPEMANQEEVADYLNHFAIKNPGVSHPLFNYLEHEASRDQVEMFLRGEVIRNEVVDDEVALLTFGLQGTQKAVAAANLWDECGRGRLDHFHTFWLRRFINASTSNWTDFLHLRQMNPWFAKITSNTNNMLLTRPAYKQMAYGCFTVFESWVEPHFRALLAAMSRLGMDDVERKIYFTAHIAVDPRHSLELNDGVRLQYPPLMKHQLRNLVRGAHLAARAGCQQYDYWLDLFRSSANQV